MSAKKADEFFRQHLALVEAAGKLYYAGVWQMPEAVMPLAGQQKLWEDLRDALGLKPGVSTAVNAVSTPPKTGG